jgi:glucokinase
MNAANRAIGIDIGGTRMLVALVVAPSRIVARTALATEATNGFDRGVDRLSHAIGELLAQSNTPASALAGVGIGCAGPVDPLRGLINNPYTLEGWDHCDIVTPLRERFGVPAYLENDADAAGLGECCSGSGRGFDPVVMLTFGTGVGGAIVVNGRIYRGVNGEHPELGHMAAAMDGPACYCGNRGCLESLASGTALGTAGKELDLADARAVFASAAGGNRAAQAIVERALGAAASAAWTLCHTILPQRLILGGGMMDSHFELFAGAIRTRLQSATQFTRGAVGVVRAALGNDAGVVGAAAIAFQRGAPLSPSGAQM